MFVAVTVDKRKTQDASVQAALPKLPFRSYFARRIRLLRMHLVLFHRWTRCIFVIYQAGARHDEAGSWRVPLHSRDESTRAFEVGASDLLLVQCPKDCCKMNDRRDAFKGFL